MAQSDLFEQGLSVRREVLGRDYVDSSLANATELTGVMQQLTTEFCWGRVWTRDGLDKRTRSLINLGMLTALGQTEELKVHVRGAVNNGCTLTEIQEALLQAAVYCGVPAGMKAFRVAQEALGAVAADGPVVDAAVRS
jgi:4-carboxymuconolactone decarboxylase